MQLGYIRISKHDGSQVLDLQRDAMCTIGILPERICQDLASGRHRPPSWAGRLPQCTPTRKYARSAGWKLVFGIFATLSKFEAELIRKWTRAGLAAARTRGCCGGRPRKV